MCEAYLKQLKVNGGGEFTVVRIAAETEEALAVKRDIYLGDDFQDATEEEYHAQFASRTAPVEPGSADEALGKEEAPAEEPKAEPQPEPQPEQPADEQPAAPDKES